jgi:hypothetical protein
MDLIFNFDAQELLLLQSQLMNEAKFHLQRISPAFHQLLLYFIVKFEIKGHLRNLVGLVDCNSFTLRMFFGVH